MSIGKIALCAALLSALTGGTAFAAHPLITDDAGTQGKGVVQIELNGEFSSDKESAAGSTTRYNGGQIAATIGLGVTDKMDLVFGVTRPWGSGDTDGISFNDPGSVDFSLGMKWQVYEHEGFSIAVKPQLGYSYAVHTPGDDYTMSYGAALVLSREIGKLALHLNGGYTYNDYHLDTGSRNSIWNASLAATYQVIDSLKLVADFGLSTNADKTSSEMPAFGLAGVIYSINSNIDLSAGIKAGLNKAENDLTGLFGATLKF